MGGLLDKLALFACCVLLLPLEAFSPWCLAALLSAVCLSLLEQLFPGKILPDKLLRVSRGGLLPSGIFLFAPFWPMIYGGPGSGSLLPASGILLFQLEKFPPMAMAAFLLFTGLSAH